MALVNTAAAGEAFHQFPYHGFGVAEEHPCFVVEVEFVINAREARVLAALDGKDSVCFFCLDDADFVAHCRRENTVGLRQLADGFRRLGLEHVPSVGNFILVRVGDGGRVFAELQRRGVIVRPVKSYGLPEWVRVTVGTPAQNERFLAGLGEVLGR